MTCRIALSARFINVRVGIEFNRSLRLSIKSDSLRERSLLNQSLLILSPLKHCTPLPWHLSSAHRACSALLQPSLFRSFPVTSNLLGSLLAHSSQRLLHRWGVISSSANILHLGSTNSFCCRYCRICARAVTASNFSIPSPLSLELEYRSPSAVEGSRCNHLFTALWINPSACLITVQVESHIVSVYSSLGITYTVSSSSLWDGLSSTPSMLRISETNCSVGLAFVIPFRGHTKTPGCFTFSFGERRIPEFPVLTLIYNHCSPISLQQKGNTFCCVHRQASVQQELV